MIVPGLMTSTIGAVSRGRINCLASVTEQKFGGLFQMERLFTSAPAEYLIDDDSVRNLTWQISGPCVIY